MTPNEVESLKAELYPVSYKAVAFGEHFYSFNSDSSHVYTLQSSFVQAGQQMQCGKPPFISFVHQSGL